MSNLENLKNIRNTQVVKRNRSVKSINPEENTDIKKSLSDELKRCLDKIDPNTGLTWRQAICEGLIRSASKGNI